jgi:hypothetical protein
MKTAISILFLYEQYPYHPLFKKIENLHSPDAAFRGIGCPSAQPAVPES